MFYKLSIFHKMLIAPLLAITLFGFYIANAYTQQVEGKKYIDSIYQKHFPILNLANENIILLDNIIRVFEDAVAAGEASWLENSKIYKQSINLNFKELEKQTINQETISNMKEHFQNYFNTSITLSSLMINQSEQWEKIEILTKEMTNYLTTTRELFKGFKQEQNQKLQETIDITNQYGEKIVQLGIVIGVFSLALIIFLTIFLSLSTKKSLKELLTSIKNIAAGNPDFSKRLEKNSDDELGELVEEFNKFTKKLQGDYEELALAKAKAEEANKIKSEFVANMSHEIRTPLNAIVGFSELLNNTEVSSKQKSYLDSIASGGDTLLAIINDILDMSKIEAGKLEIEYEEVSLKPIIKDIEQIFSQKIKEKKLDFRLVIDSNLPAFVLTDEVRLRQILLNIVGNAVKFTHKGYIEVDLKASNFKGNIFDLQIDVKDSGIGIPKDEQKKIFESFVQQNGQSNRQYGGTGLGLAICQKLINMMNGKIKLQSSENEGTKFSIILNSLEIVDSKKNMELKKENVDIEFENSTILLVDDIELNRKLVIESLSEKNITFLEATNGKEAIFIAKNEKPNLILMDIKMPVLDGLEATRILKENEKSNIPIIALTASVRAKEIKGLSTIFDGYITKPVSSNTLINELKRFLIYKTKTKEKEQTNEEVLKVDEDIKEVFIEEFEKDIKEKWLKASQGCSTEDIFEFIAILIEFAKIYEQRELLRFSNSLSKAVEDFDILTIENSIEEFSIFLKKIKND